MVEDTIVRGDAGAAGVELAEARGLEVEGADVAAAAIELRSGFVAPLLPPAGVGRRGGIVSAGVADPKSGLTRCSLADRERNMESI